MDFDGLVPAAVELGILLVSIFAGGSYALRKIRRDQPSLTSELARDLRQSTPNPERDQLLIPRTDGEQIIASFGAVVGDQVERKMEPLERRVIGRVDRLSNKVDRLQRQVDRLADADAEIQSRQDDQSRRLEHVEDIATAPITLELELGDEPARP